MDLNTPITELSGVGSARGKSLTRLGIKTVRDLLYYFPREYEDRTKLYSIAQAPVAQKVCVQGMVADIPHLSHLRHGLDVVKVRIVDQSGSMSLSFFNQPYLKTTLTCGQDFVFYGKVEQFGSQKQMTNPYFEKTDQLFYTGRIIPVYPLTHGIQNRFLSSLIESVLHACLEQICDPLPVNLRQSYSLADLSFSLTNIHFPISFESLKLAQIRLIFEEFFYLSCALSILGGRHQTDTGIQMRSESVQKFSSLLPFQPTSAQITAMEELAADMSSRRPMNRLLQGDVGSGKTVVAAFGAWMAWRNGYQCALMAPTEVLAEQHYKTLSGLFDPVGIRVELLTGSTPFSEKQIIRNNLATGKIDLILGTHALLSDNLNYNRLGLVVTDEQHRFGVKQRATLSAKADTPPHVLVMSATPIPRTLALMIYGDLDISVLDELPPGRQPVQTFLISSKLHMRLYNFVRKQIKEGHQVYIVCPAVEESDQSGDDLKTVITFAHYLQTDIFPDLRVGIAHGRMKSQEKQTVMNAFALGKIDILVSTTVVEVGVDVPNASLMIVENAERFGLSQLHQLRGRVGRSNSQSYCVLVSNHPSKESQARLKILTQTTDGFKISEEDLKKRGPGDFFGQRQHGLPPLKIANLAGDMYTLKKAQQAAKDLLDMDPNLSRNENQGIREQVQKMFSDDLDLGGGTLFAEENILES